MRSISLLSALIIIFSTLGCGPRVTIRNITDTGYAFPDREALQPKNSLEWWYFTGHMEDANKNTYGVEFVIFHFSPTGKRAYTMLNVGLSNRRTGEFIYDYSIQKMEEESTQLPLNLIVKETDINGMLQGQEGNYTIKANMFGENGNHYGIQLNTVEDDAPWLHEPDGYEKYGDYAKAGYYSYPRLETEGKLMWDGELLDVSGELWYDRQWDCLAVLDQPVRWDWFSFQLDNGDNIMVYKVTLTKTGEEILGGSLLREGESSISLSQDQIQLEPARYWDSPRTKKQYALEWNVKIPDYGYDLNLSTPISNQELTIRFAPFVKLNYWEGMIDITGSHSGIGFMELTNP